MMSKLIYADEVKKRFPIMENDFGMVVNETLHKELDKIPTVKAIPGHYRGRPRPYGAMVRDRTRNRRHEKVG